MTEQSDSGAPVPEAADDPVDAPATAAETDAIDDADPRALRSLVRFVAIEVFLYVVVALVLVFLALRRGRLSDAILVTLTVMITTPMILGYRQQALARLRARGKPREQPADAAGESDGDGGESSPPAA